MSESRIDIGDKAPMFDFYKKEGFALFKCNLDKTPAVPHWKEPEWHIPASEAEERALHGHYVGARVPPNYIVIDIDRGHKNGIDGGEAFAKICEDLDIAVPETYTVRTASGGEHLYFTLPDGTDYQTLSQKALAKAVDVRTHSGYVIAAGTNGYYVLHDRPPIEIPEPLIALMQSRAREFADPIVPDLPLPVEVLQTVLSKLPIAEFDTNDVWQEFVTSCIAVSGNHDEVIDALEEWSKSDPAYKDDPSIRKRLQSFEIAGGITAGTFIHVIKNHGISKYLVDKVRTYVGAQFNFGDRSIDKYDAPFEVDYSLLSELKTEVRGMYYQKLQGDTLDVLVRLVRGTLIYVSGERLFYYFDGNRWVEREKVVTDVIYPVLMNVALRFYSDYSKEKDSDADEYLAACIKYLSTLHTTMQIQTVLMGHTEILHGSVDWDSPSLAATLTLRDGVLDFSDHPIKFRKGRREEYRRLYIDLSVTDFDNREMPEKFRAFLKDVFPDKDTRKTATYALSTMISGTGRFRTFQLWNGAGSNGKSTLMELMKALIGERAITYKPEILLNKSHTQSLTPELAMFRGALVGFASETEESKRVSQGQVKALTGNETIVANPKYQAVIEFATTFQLVLSTNYLPTFSAHDAAFIDRLLILPFYTCFYKTEEQKERAGRRGSRYFIESRDPDAIKAEVLAERAQVLYYLAMRYQEISGGAIPESAECLEAKRHYVDDNNDIFQFFNEFLEEGEEYFTPSKDLVDFYNEENNTRYSGKFVAMRLKEAFPNVVTGKSHYVDGRKMRGIWGIRICYGAFPQGWQGNFSSKELSIVKMQEAEF
jgi:P4 family phage/plasmid primase-like protien